MALALAALTGLQPVGAQTAARPDNVSASEMERFVAAARRVHKLWREADMPISSEVRKEMVEAIRAEGLEVKAYNRIARGVRGNDSLYERYQQGWNEGQD